MLEPGQPAPDFTLPDQDGKEVTLSKLKGSPVVLYFYPKGGARTEGAGLAVVRSSNRRPRRGQAHGGGQTSGGQADAHQAGGGQAAEGLSTLLLLLIRLHSALSKHKLPAFGSSTAAAILAVFLVTSTDRELNTRGPAGSSFQHLMSGGSLHDTGRRARRGRTTGRLPRAVRPALRQGAGPGPRLRLHQGA